MVQQMSFGACVLALAMSAPASIVHVPLSVAGPSGPGETVNIDITGDGAAEFVMWFTPGGDMSIPGLYRMPVPGVEVLQGSNVINPYDPARLAAGAEIGPATTGPAGYAWDGDVLSWLFFGTWWDGVEGYMPFRLAAADGYHYGWLDIDPPFESMSGFLFVGAAYETRPDTPIVAGQVPSPGAVSLSLAVGAVIIRRREKRGASLLRRPKPGDTTRQPV